MRGCLEVLLEKISKLRNDGVISSITVVPEVVVDSLRPKESSTLQKDKVYLRFLVWCLEEDSGLECDYGTWVEGAGVDLYNIPKEDLFILKDYTEDLSFHPLIHKYWESVGYKEENY